MSGQTYASPNFSVLAQLASGGFASPVEYRVGEGILTSGIGVGDVTGDGRNDVIASYEGLAVFAQTPLGTLSEPTIYPTDNGAKPVEVVDVNLDSRPDVVTAHNSSNVVGVYLQQPDGSLASEDEYGIPVAQIGPHSLAVGDINGDGAPDVVIADRAHGLVVLYNTLPEQTNGSSSADAETGSSATVPEPDRSCRPGTEPMTMCKGWWQKRP